MPKNGLGEYHIVPSMHDVATYFLFCPCGSEKKFGITVNGKIIEWKGSFLSNNEKQVIKEHFGI